jgi:hypothetical protein
LQLNILPAVSEASCCVHPNKRFQRRQWYSDSWNNLRKWSVWDGKLVRCTTVLRHDTVNITEETLTRSQCRSLRSFSKEIRI